MSIICRGTVTVYVDEVKDGITHQHEESISIRFSRAGDTSAACKGRLVLRGGRVVNTLVGQVPMLYGVKGKALRDGEQDCHKGNLVVSTSFDTDDCDNIFGNAGGLTWGEVFNG